MRAEKAAACGESITTPTCYARLMTDPQPDTTSGERPEGRGQSPRFRVPRVDFVTLILALLVTIILLFVTAEMWLPHMGD